MADQLTKWLHGFTAGSGVRESAIRAAGLGLRGGSAAEALDFVCAACGLPCGAAEGRINDAVHGHDASFDAKQHVAQAQIAAAWVVASILQPPEDESPGPSVVVAALGLLSADFLNKRPPQHELIEMAWTALRAASERDRERPRLPQPNRSKALTDHKPFTEGVPVTGTELNRVLSVTRTAMQTMSLSVGRLRDAAAQNLKADAEELDILWWMFGGRRDGDGETWKELGSGAGILAGAGLADLTRFDTPIASADTLLQRVLDDIPPADVSEAVASAVQMVSASGDGLVHPLLPLYRAMRESDGVESVNGQVDQWRLGEQFLRETLLMRRYLS